MSNTEGPYHNRELRTTEAGLGTTRRGLVAAAAIFAAALATRKAHAFSRAPRGGPSGGGSQCFLAGTRIRTPDGDTKVESLAIGDLVATFDGGAKPIKWIGRRRLERAAGELWSADDLPVKIARAALGAQTPHADLFLSPMHAVFLDGLLIPVRNLINGRSIAQCAAFDADVIEYFHIELAGHDVIFAEGAPAETLLATGDRKFDNWELDASRPALAQPEPFAPVVSPSRKAAIRSRLRSAVSPWVDRRQPVDVIWDRIAARAEMDIAA